MPGKSKAQKAIFKIITWLAFAIVAGLLPLFKGSFHNYYEAIESGELYLIGAVVALAALGDLLYSTLPISEAKQLKVGKTDVFSILFLISIILCLAMVIINLVNAVQVPEAGPATIEESSHNAYNVNYLIYIFTAAASLGTVVLGAMIDD